MKTWTKADILAIFDRNDKVGDAFVCRSVVKIYERQTTDEQISKSTHYNNGIGFNGADAEILSSFAQWYLKTGFLSTNQLIIAKKKIRKYAQQLANIANETV